MTLLLSITDFFLFVLSKIYKTRNHQQRHTCTATCDARHQQHVSQPITIAIFTQNDTVPPRSVSVEFC